MSEQELLKIATKHCGQSDNSYWLEYGVLAAISEAVAAERERCARICEHQWLGRGFPGGGISDLDDLDRNTQRMCASAIRQEEGK